MTRGTHSIVPHAQDTTGRGNPVEILRSILVRSLAGEAQGDLAIAKLLAASRRKKLPLESDELLALVERYLLADLREEIGQVEAHALMDELADRLAARTSPDQADDEELHHHTTKPPPAERSPTSKSTVRPLPPSSHPVRVSTRRSVLVIDPDRMARANLSRALARAGCEITVRDSCAGVGLDVTDFDVIVTEIVGVAIEELLDTFARDPPMCAVVAWTLGVNDARTMLAAAGFGDISVIAKESRPDALVAAVRANLGGVASVVRG